MANLKFSQFTEQTDTSNVQFIVGYNGATNVRISPANIIDGTVTSVTTGNSNTITIGGTSAAPTVAANTAAVTNGSLNLATGDQIYDFVIGEGYTTNTGTVESVGLAMPAAFSVASSPVTTSGTLTVTGAGTTAQYIRGDGTLATLPGGFTSFDITGGSGSAQTITDGNTITLAQGTGISTVAGATDTVTITNTDTGSSQNIFKNVASDSGTAVADNNNDTLTITGGTNVSTAVVGDTLTITATDTNTQYTAGTGLTLSSTVFNTNVDGTQSTAANTSTTTAARTYKVQVDSSDNLVVNVPWTSGSSGIAGSLADDQVAFGNGTDTIAGSDDFAWNGNTLTLGGSTGTGNLVAQLITGESLTSNNNISLATVVQHQGDTNTKFGFPANDTFTIDTNGLERMRVASTGAIQLNAYGSGTFTGTAAYTLSVDSSGNIIETTGGGAAYPFSTDGVNSLYSGFVPSGTLTGTENTILGIDAGSAITSNDDNTLIGYKAGFAGGTGFNYNTVVGSEAFDAATTCQYNVVAGYQAGSTVTSNVSYCTIIGNSAAGFASGTATGATAIGASSMSQSVISNSTGVGYNTFRTSTNAFTTAVGASAAYSGGGNYGTHVGYQAGRNVTGLYNICIGRNAGNTGIAITSGARNTLVGTDISTSSSILSRATVIGYGASDNGDNTVTLGDSNITGLHCQVQTISALSDSRDKTNIQKSSYGLDVIEKLNPVTFEWDQRDGNRKGLKDLGFIAQELQESDDEYLQLVNSNNPEKLQASYGRLIPVMIKAIQELQEEIKYLKNK